MPHSRCQYGLPELAGSGGAVSLESLFLDEGFGSLDAAALDIAIEGLERLAGGRRMIGVISHVPEIAERLPDRVQVVKGWIEAGQSHQEVFDVAGDPDNGATVDTDTCVATGPGEDELCTVWTDPSFDPAAAAFYYVRVLENPTCRWSTITCNALAPMDRPASCTDPDVKKTVQERAWSSPIWYRPGA